MEQVQSHSCFVCWWLREDLLGWGSGSDCLFASNKAHGGRLLGQGPTGLKVSKAGERHDALSELWSSPL